MSRRCGGCTAQGSTPSPAHTLFWIHTPQSELTPGPADPRLLFAGATCPTCKAHSPRLYAEGWICVQPACAQFWMLSTPRGLFPIPLGMALTFDPAFLEPAPTPPHRRSVPFSVVPPAPSGAETGESDDAQSGSRTLWKGASCRLTHADVRQAGSAMPAGGPTADTAGSGGSAARAGTG